MRQQRNSPKFSGKEIAANVKAAKDGVDPIRSRIMRSVRRTNTTPEIIVRKFIHSLGLRFRLHRRDLPGSPDIVLPKLKTVVFVHGCFWHRHPNCPRTTTPAQRVQFWAMKFEANVSRDQRVVTELKKLGWEVLIVWECETKVEMLLKRRLRKLL